MTPALLRRWRPPALALPSWPWRITWTYLGLILFLPLGAMLLRAAEVGPAGFWEMATTPEAIATYKVSFGLALVASVINGVFGLVVAWALVRCRFPGQRLLDALIDLPFALPTAVAGLALTAVYSTNGWLGQPLHEAFGIKVAFAAPGVTVAMVFISLPFVVRTVEPVLRSSRRSRRRPPGAWGPHRSRPPCGWCCPSSCRRSSAAWPRATAGPWGSTARW